MLEVLIILSLPFKNFEFNRTRKIVYGLLAGVVFAAIVLSVFASKFKAAIFIFALLLTIASIGWYIIFIPVFTHFYSKVEVQLIPGLKAKCKWALFASMQVIPVMIFLMFLITKSIGTIPFYAALFCALLFSLMYAFCVINIFLGYLSFLTIGLSPFLVEQFVMIPHAILAYGLIACLIVLPWIYTELVGRISLDALRKNESKFMFGNADGESGNMQLLTQWGAEEKFDLSVFQTAWFKKMCELKSQSLRARLRFLLGSRHIQYLFLRKQFYVSLAVILLNYFSLGDKEFSAIIPAILIGLPMGMAFQIEINAQRRAKELELASTCPNHNMSELIALLPKVVELQIFFSALLASAMITLHYLLTDQDSLGRLCMQILACYLMSACYPNCFVLIGQVKSAKLAKFLSLVLIIVFAIFSINRNLSEPELSHINIGLLILMISLYFYRRIRFTKRMPKRISI